MKTLKIIVAVVAFAAILYGCERFHHEGDMTVKMTDAPGPYAHVNVEVTEVEVHYADEGKGSTGWMNVDTKVAVYDLIDLQSGLTVVIADEKKLPAGKITEIRLHLGSNNNLVAGGVTYDLKIASGFETGIKIGLDTEIDVSKRTEIILDFDANTSVVLEGNGTYSLKPVITVKSTATFKN